MLLIEDRLVDAMRLFVVATNRLEHVSAKAGADQALLDQVSEERRQTALALQQALVERGWRHPAS